MFSRDAEQQGQIAACKELGMALMAYGVVGCGMLSSAVPQLQDCDELRKRLPRFADENVAASCIRRSKLWRTRTSPSHSGHRLDDGPSGRFGTFDRADPWVQNRASILRKTFARPRPLGSWSLLRSIALPRLAPPPGTRAIRVVKCTG